MQSTAPETCTSARQAAASRHHLVGSELDRRPGALGGLERLHLDRDAAGGLADSVRAALGARLETAEVRALRREEPASSGEPSAAEMECISGNLPHGCLQKAPLLMETLFAHLVSHDLANVQPRLLHPILLGVSGAREDEILNLRGKKQCVVESQRKQEKEDCASPDLAESYRAPAQCTAAEETRES